MSRFRARASSVMTSAFRSLEGVRNPTIRAARFEALSAQGPLVLVRDGEETFVIFTSDKIISKTLYIGGNRFFERLTTTLEVLGKDFQLDTLVDVGANLGIVCIPAIRRGLARRAIAIEPEPGNYRLLVANIHLNGVADRITHHNVALGPQADQLVEFELSPDNSGDHRVSVTSEDGLFSEAGRRRIRVRSTRFDDLAPEVERGSFLIWMEAQGYEGPILEGASKAVAARVPVLAEFCPYLMKRTACYERFVRAIGGYTTYVDLKDAERRRVPISAESIGALAEKLGDAGAYTDILLM